MFLSHPTFRELDLDSITFPPVALRTAREAKGLYLELAWTDLERDSDSDGLTDLLEEGIVTDPQSADTDGDGMSDSRDPLPQVALTPGRSVRAEALAIAAGGHQLGTGALTTGLVDSEEEKNACVVRESRIGEATLFLIGDRQSFAPLDLPRRTVVLTPAEHELYEKKFGPTFGAMLGTFIVDHTNTRVIIELNESWKGTMLLLTRRKDGTWKSEVLSAWIS